jgi:hypothetical protein
MMSKRLLLAIALLAAMVLSDGCTLRAKQHPASMTYDLPTKLTVNMGETIPGTDIRYERMSDQGAYVRIKGQEALKRTGDSLDWSGQPMAGVTLDLKLRVAVFNEDALHLVGTAKIKLDNVAPRVAPISTNSPLEFTGPVAYSIGKGAVLPGSTLTYLGRSNEGAQLGGSDEYPYRKGGDSIYWEGKLSDQVNIRGELRVVQYDDRVLRTAGLVTIWLGN